LKPATLMSSGTRNHRSRIALYAPRARILARENKRLKFQGNFFNVFNFTNLSNPDTGLPDGDFGKITKITSDDGQPREIQLGFEFTF